MIIHVITNKAVEFGATFQDSLHFGTTEVEITIFEAKLFGRFFTVIVGIDRMRFGLIKQSKLIYD